MNKFYFFNKFTPSPDIPDPKILFFFLKELRKIIKLIHTNAFVFGDKNGK